jgi:hypothetical protein
MLTLYIVFMFYIIPRYLSVEYPVGNMSYFQPFINELNSCAQHHTPVVCLWKDVVS